MARYIDADLLIKEMFAYEKIDKRQYMINGQLVFDEIQKMPSADVVPKSEVEKIADVAQKNIDSANERAEIFHKESEKLRVLYENARSKIAREIFEEMEKLVIKIRYDPDYSIFDMQKDFAELKKKYMEE